MSNEFSIDESGWPLVHIRVPIGIVSDDELLRSVEVLSEIATRGEPYVLLFDARGSSPLGAAQRRMVAEASEPTAGHAAKNCVGSAIIVTNAVVAGIVTAIHWLKSTDYPERAFSNEEDARAWLSELQHSSPPG